MTRAREIHARLKYSIQNHISVGNKQNIVFEGAVEVFRDSHQCLSSDTSTYTNHTTRAYTRALTFYHVHSTAA